MKSFKSFLSEENLDDHDVLTASEKLHKTTGDIPHPDLMRIKKYTYDSSGLNKTLIHINHPLGGEEIHNAIIRHSKPSGHHITLHSGTHEDFGKLARSSTDGIFHSPAHISASHDIKVAENFSPAVKHIRHMINIHIKPSDKILHISKYSSSPEEQETIIPAGTKLQYHGTDTSEGKRHTVHSHNFTIHDQSDIKEVHHKAKDEDIHRMLTSDTDEIRHNAEHYEHLEPKHLIQSINHHLESKNKRLAAKLANHPKSDISVINHIAPHLDASHMAKLFGHKSLSVSDIKEIADKHNDPEVKANALLHIEHREK